MKIWIPIALALFLSGCAYSDALFTRGAKFYDDMLQGAVDVKCRVASGGALQRRYMQTPETWKLWTDECLPGGGSVIPALPYPTDG